jgi:hypothetical protein
MKPVYPIALCIAPILACAPAATTSQQELARGEVTTTVDTFWDWPYYVPMYQDELFLSDGFPFAARALVPADTIARNLAARLDGRLGPDCPAAVVNDVDAARVDVRWGCTLGDGAQSVTLSGGSTAVVTTDDITNTATFTHSTTGLRVDDASIDAASAVRITAGNPKAKFTHTAVITRGSQTTSVDQRGDIALDDSDPRAVTLTISGTREVSRSGATRTQTWRDVTFREGVRLPISGDIRVEGASGGVVDVTFTNDGANEVTVEAAVTGSDGRTERFNFTVDPVDNTVTLMP